MNSVNLIECIENDDFYEFAFERGLRDFKATGGLRGQKKIPLLRCQRFLRNAKILPRLEVIGVSMCWPFDFSIVILGVIFDILYTFFGYKD